MKAPKQVEEAAELATKLHSAMMNPEQAAPEEEEATPETETETEPQETDEQQTEQEDIAELKKFKEQYLHLKGKYDAEVPRLNKDLQELKQSIIDKLGVAPEPEKKVNERLKKFREEYTDEFVDNLIELFKEEVDPLLKEKFAPVEKKVSSIEQDQFETAQREFVGNLESLVKGDWRKLWDGEDAKFNTFKQKSDPSGLYTYGELLDMYNDKWDYARMAKVFNSYLEESKSPEVPKKDNPTKDAMIAPNRSTTTTTPTIDEKIIWTPETIAEFQKADRQGKYDAETSKAMWQDLMAAPSQGRIR